MVLLHKFYSFAWAHLASAFIQSNWTSVRQQRWNVTSSSWAGSGSKSWLVRSLYPPSISLCTSPSTGCVFGCCTPSLCVNSFPTPLILDAICNSFSGLSYLCATSRACPVPALLSVYHNCTSVEKQIKQHRSPVSAVSIALGCLLLAILPTPPCRVALGSTALYYAVYTYAWEQ